MESKINLNNKKEIVYKKIFHRKKYKIEVNFVYPLLVTNLLLYLNNHFTKKLTFCVYTVVQFEFPPKKSRNIKPNSFFKHFFLFFLYAEINLKL